jgi:hypothetical protein
VEASFGIVFKQKDFEGALLYKLQRKHANITDKHPNSSTASINDTATNVYFLVVWDVKDHNHKFYVCLIECPDDFTWDEDKLWTWYNQYYYQFNKDYELNLITWSMHDNTVMKIRRNVTYGSDYKLDISISEGTGKYNMKRPIKIDPKRLVLSLLALIVLIYAVSLLIPSSFKLNIHNQCLNVDLVSPVYITDLGLDYHRPPGHNVCTGDTMRSGFIIDEHNFAFESSDVLCGALIYGLQRKQIHGYTEMNEDALSSARLLVVWEISRSKELYADALLIKHDKGFNWDKSDLEELYRKNSNQFRMFFGYAIETWSLDDSVALMIALNIMNKNHILDITISELKRHDSTRVPTHIDLKR